MSEARRAQPRYPSPPRRPNGLNCCLPVTCKRTFEDVLKETKIRVGPFAFMTRLLPINSLKVFLDKNLAGFVVHITRFMAYRMLVFPARVEWCVCVHRPVERIVQSLPLP